jgi:outer membrane cobalamin receptor
MPLSAYSEWEGGEQRVSQKTCQVIFFHQKAFGRKAEDASRTFFIVYLQCFIVCLPGPLVIFLKKRLTYFLVLVFLPAWPLTLFGQSADTLSPVKVISKKQFDPAAETVPVQVLDKKALSNLNSLSVADAVKYFSGVVVKDYGGIGGLKTISVRSLGANHTGVMLDGLIIGDAQGGQVDLGRYSLNNLESIQLFNNQPPDILLPARVFASAAVISLSSVENNREGTQLATLACRTGSFGYIEPSLVFSQSVNKHFGYTLQAAYQSATGDYPYTNYESGNSDNKRKNSDIRTYRLEYDGSYAFNDSSKAKLKTYFYDSKRGLPGGVIFYNTIAGQRLDNRNFFSQFSWQGKIKTKSRLLISGKYSTDYKYYIDPSYPNSAGKLENEFHQQEVYVSAVYAYKLTGELSASYAVDYFISRLRRTDAFAGSFPDPTRNSLLNNLALRFKKKYIEADGNLLYTSTDEKVRKGLAGNVHDEFSPSVSVSVQPFTSPAIRLRGSYKMIFRVPTFDDLYYTNIGNIALRPEYAKQFNAGFTVKLAGKSFVETILLTTDAYYNKVTDKILAIPRQNLFQWTMSNIGRVVSKGVDAGAQLKFKKWKQAECALRVSYGFQDARDRSAISSPLYNTLLPYMPRHSGSIAFTADIRKFSVNYNILSSAFRYQQGVPGPENVVQGWATHDFSVRYLLTPDVNWQFAFVAEANNIYNKQYEIIKYYPMPRFNYRLGITVTHTKFNHKTK